MEIVMISNTDNKMLVSQTRETLSGNWGKAIGTFFFFTLLNIVVYALIGAILAAIFYGGDYSTIHNNNTLSNVSSLLSILISAPVTVGLSLFALSLVRRSGASFSQGFAGFKKYWLSVGTSLLYALYIILWSLLLVIPGIIAAFRYAAAYYLIADNKASTPSEAIRLSKEIMYGNKSKLFKLNMRFIGWFLLSIVTLGIGFLWFVPYISVANAKFYEDLQDKK